MNAWKAGMVGVAITGGILGFMTHDYQSCFPYVAALLVMGFIHGRHP